jgi:hypothetical protein
MNEPIWSKFLTERDKQVFASAGYGVRQGFGSDRGLCSASSAVSV